MAKKDTDFSDVCTTGCFTGFFEVIFFPISLLINGVKKLISIIRKRTSANSTVFEDLQDKPGQSYRIERAAHTNIYPGSIDYVRKTAQFIGSQGELYDVSLNSCTCMDFKKRCLPCKHMYRLAMDLGVFNMPCIREEKLGGLYQSKKQLSYLSKLQIPKPRNFKVVGINPATGRKNTRHITAIREDKAIEFVKESGLTDPFEIEDETVFIPPTENQLSYAHDLGIYVPEDANSKDVSAMISRVLDNDRKLPSLELANFAIDCGAEISPYVGEKAIIGFIEYVMQPSDIYAFSIYRKYCELKSEVVGDMRKSDYYAQFYSFGQMKVDNDPITEMEFLENNIPEMFFELYAYYAYAVHRSIINLPLADMHKSPLLTYYMDFAKSADARTTKSILGRPKTEYRNPNKNTIAYKAAAEFIRKNIPKRLFFAQ